MVPDGDEVISRKGGYMKFNKGCAAVIVGAAMMGCLTFPVRAQPGGVPQPVFACSLGKKSVFVTAVGNQLIYKFGTPTNTDMSIIGSADRKNVLYRADRYAGMEYQLRFVNGPYSYIVYNMEGNGNTGARAVSGLLVMKDTKTVARMSCTRYAEFSANFDYSSLPEDSEDYSAMSN
jgi:hypothetical protein